MLNYAIRRVITVLPVLWAAASLTFLALHLLPGDPATVQMAHSGASAEAIAQRRAEMGLDDPLETQYVRYLSGLLRGDLGRAWSSHQPVSQIIGQALPATAALSLAATAVGILLGLTLGTGAALRQGTWLDTACMGLALTGVSTPVILSGLVGVLLFSLTLEWLPATGQGDLSHILLPALVLGWNLAGSLARLTRDGLLDVMNQPFITAARARGVPRWRIISRHAGRVALPSVLTILALQVGFLLGGTVITETLFARRGLGRIAVQAVIDQDLPTVQGVVLLAAATYTLANLLADLAHLWLDPRLRKNDQ